MYIWIIDVLIGIVIVVIGIFIFVCKIVFLMLFDVIVELVCKEGILFYYLFLKNK